MQIYLLILLDSMVAQVHVLHHKVLPRRSASLAGALCPHHPNTTAITL